MDQSNRGFLADCEKEQLHASGAIQGFGAMLILNEAMEPTHRSANFKHLTGMAPDDVAELLQREKQIPAIRSLSETPGSRLYVEAAIESEAGLLDLVISRGEDHRIMLEFLPAEASRFTPVWIAPPEMKSIVDTEQLQQLRKNLIAWVAEVTGFERVMYYQFLEGGDGEVVAETCDERCHGSYLGLRFPASDIPQIARNIYLQNPWRVISDAAAEYVPLLGEGSTNLTWCDLRSVSPVHAVYMQNMGDRASFSLPVTAGQELEALIACHSALPGTLPLARLKAVHEVVRSYNMLLRDFRSRTRVRLVDEITRTIRRELEHQASISNTEAWQHLSHWLLREFEADALVWCQDGQVSTAGVDVEDELIRQLDDWFSRHCQELVFVEDRLRNTLSVDVLTSIAGAAGLRFRRDGENTSARLYLLRSEQVEEVSWGGNPDKPVEHHDGVLGIAPRRSFAKWVEKRLGYSRAWGGTTRLKLLRLRDELQRFESALPCDATTSSDAD